MTQICLRNITISHSSLPLVENADLSIEAGERVTLIGRNGAGKSTLLKLIHGDIQPDQGVIERTKDLKIALLPQSVPEAISGSVREIVTSKLKEQTEEYWQDTSLVEKILSKLKLEGEEIFTKLSGGMKRLVLLASILVQEPDVLLLDEPTNHLDIDKILLLENLLLSHQKTIIFVTHDRALLQKLATHIVEIDNGKLISWRGEYDRYLQHKEMLVAAETKSNALFDKKLAQEEKWIRQGIKARRTRNEGRVRMLKKMRAERTQRRSKIGKVNLQKNDIELSGKIVFEISNLTFFYDNKCIINNFSSTILRGDKVGIIGPNGAGKTTLINLLLGNLLPNKGEVKHGTKITIGYFDQHRLQLNPETTIYDAVGEMGDTIMLGTQQKHIMSYLQDFLFTPQQVRTKIKNLSGGERNRVMLAKLFTKPCNVLVLDEPTNDLDVETLELLEEMLLDFKGTLLLISHDRSFLNNVVTSTLVFGENGKIDEYIGGYDDFIMQSMRDETQSHSQPKEVVEEDRPKITEKLSYKEKKELEALPAKIEALENEQRLMNEKLSDPMFYKKDPDNALKCSQTLHEIDIQLNRCYERWEELEKKN